MNPIIGAAAKRATELVRASDPNFRIQNVKYRLPHRQPEVLQDALRKAGMPEIIDELGGTRAERGGVDLCGPTTRWSILHQSA